MPQQPYNMSQHQKIIAKKQTKNNDATTTKSIPQQHKTISQQPTMPHLPKLLPKLCSFFRTHKDMNFINYKYKQ